MSIDHCHNFEDFRKLAKKKLPSPIFHYIDGGSDDEITLKRNTDSFNKCDLIPNVLTGASDVDLTTTVLGQKIDFPLFLSATAMHRLYNHEGEKATAKAAEKMGTMFGISTMSTTSIEEIGKLTKGPKLFQLYIHKDKGLTDNLNSMLDVKQSLISYLMLASVELKILFYDLFLCSQLRPHLQLDTYY